MSIRDESKAYELGRKLFAEHMGHEVPHDQIHTALITSGLPITIDLLAEIQQGYQDAQWRAAWSNPS